jgi:hypothetical protein
MTARAAADRRIVFERNPRRLGLVENWRRVFRLARARYPDAMYFAWGSDHDVWEPTWLERLVAELDAHPDAVLAYPRYTRIGDDGEQLKGPRGGAALQDMSQWERFTVAAGQKIGAGKMVYGLFRSEALERAGVYQPVFQPDVYLMIELALYGEIRLVRDPLWHRREGARPGPDAARPSAAKSSPGWVARTTRLIGVGSIKRQHQYLFPGRVPLYSRLPARVQHFTLLVVRLAICGRGRPMLGRLAAVKCARWFFVHQLFGDPDPKKARQTRRA